MELHPILEFISSYGYWIAVPLMILEGPLITIVMGFLASFGVVSLPVIIALSVVSDLISDTIYYWSGYHGGPKVLARFKVRDLESNSNLQRLKEKFETHPGKIFFAVKVLTGVAHTTFVLAGVTRINYLRMLKFTIPGGIVWSASLAMLGYYFGRNATSISKALTASGLILFGILCLFLLYKFYFGKLIAWRLNWFHANIQDKVSKSDSDPGG